MISPLLSISTGIVTILPSESLVVTIDVFMFAVELLEFAFFVVVLIFPLGIE